MTRMVHPNGPGAEANIVMCSVCRTILFERDYKYHLEWHDTLREASVRSLHRKKSSFGDPYCAYDNEDWPCSTIEALGEIHHDR